MAYYEGLPIYKAATDLVVALDGAVRRFSRFHKYSIGTQLRETALDVVLRVARANRRDGREAALEALCLRAEDLKILLNVAKEVKAFQSFNQYVQLMEQVVGLVRQAEGWRRSASRAVGPEPTSARCSEARR